MLKILPSDWYLLCYSDSDILLFPIWGGGGLFYIHLGVESSVTIESWRPWVELGHCLPCSWWNCHAIWWLTKVNVGRSICTTRWQHKIWTWFMKYSSHIRHTVAALAQLHKAQESRPPAGGSGKLGFVMCQSKVHSNNCFSNPNHEKYDLGALKLFLGTLVIDSGSESYVTIQDTSKMSKFKSCLTESISHRWTGNWYGKINNQ